MYLTCSQKNYANLNGKRNCLSVLMSRDQMMMMMIGKLNVFKVNNTRLPKEQNYSLKDSSGRSGSSWSCMHAIDLFTVVDLHKMKTKINKNCVCVCVT